MLYLVSSCRSPARFPGRVLVDRSRPAGHYRSIPWLAPRAQRCASSEAADDSFGQINTGPNESIVFFDHVFPIKLQWLFWGRWHAEKSLEELMSRFNSPTIAAADPISIIRRAIPHDAPLTVTQIAPRLKDGGAYVKFAHPEGTSPAEVEARLARYLRESPIKPWFNPFRRVEAYRVRGRPWLEDLYRFPSSRLKVEFVPDKPGASALELPQEELYALFRRYGKLADIKPQPADSKVLPRYALLDFAGIRQAILARNCMHGFRVEAKGDRASHATALKLSYEQKIKAHWIRDWLVSHPRLVIPAIAAIIATITVAIFDPVRTFFVRAHVEESFRLKQSRLYRWFASRATDMFSFRNRGADAGGLRALWDDRKENIEQIRTWLMEAGGSFIVVQGPRGSAKRELVLDESLKGRRYKLVIDCKPIQEARGDSAAIRAAAAEVGYRPVFSWANNLSSLIDLAAQGTIGTKTGFSETLDTQLAKILQTTATALKQVALEDRTKDDKDSALGDDEYLEAHPEKRAVVVVENFLHKNLESHVVYDKISEWAARLIISNVAHVIFLTEDASFSKWLSKALPDRVYRQISLGDCSPGVAKRIVLQHVDADADEVDLGREKLPPSQRRPDLNELDGCIETLGGRLTDLEFLARRIKLGESPNKAVQQIVEQSASSILKMYVLDPDGGQRGWTPEQAWLLVKQLATKESLRYSEVLLSGVYKTNGESALRALEQAEMISIQSMHGRPHSIRPGRPVYASAFRALIADRVLRARLELSTLNELTKSENSTVEKCEAELSLLGNLPEKGGGLLERMLYLMDKLKKSHRSIEEYEAESSKLKKILQTET